VWPPFSIKSVPRRARLAHMTLSRHVPATPAVTHVTLPSTSRGRSGWLRVLAAGVTAVVTVAMAGCTSDGPSPDDLGPPSPSSSEPAAPLDDATFSTITISPDALTPSAREASASAALVDGHDYTYDASWWASYELGEPDISSAPPGSTDLPGYSVSGVSLRNTTAGRNAPADLLASATILPLFASDRPACTVLSDVVNVAGTTYCYIGAAKYVGQNAQLNSPLAPDETSEGSSPEQWYVRVPESQVASVTADLASGPTAWVFAVRTPDLFFGTYYPGVVSPAGSCTLPGQGFGIPDTMILWASSELPGCPAPLIGGAAPAADGVAAGQVVDDLFTNWADTPLSRCPALPAGGSTIRPIVAGMDGVDDSLSFGPVSVPQDSDGNMIYCSTEPGGGEVRLGHPDLTAVDPQARANRAREINEPLTISEPIDLLGGTLIVARVSDGNGGAIVTWSDGNLNISGQIETDGAGAEQGIFDRAARWMVLNLPSMLANIAAFDPTTA